MGVVALVVVYHYDHSVLLAEQELGVLLEPQLLRLPFHSEPYALYAFHQLVVAGAQFVVHLRYLGLEDVLQQQVFSAPVEIGS